MFKFLDPTGCTYYDGKTFQYNLPQRDQKISDWTEHPDPVKPDGKVCGPRGLHVMLSLNARYAPTPWYPWWVQEVQGELGRDHEKLRVVAIRLRRIAPKTFQRSLRPPFNWGRRTCLFGVDLCYANLSGADLSSTDLRMANLYRACLRGANLHGADLYKVDLFGADLYEADLREAVLSYTNLRGANLSGADLRGIDLSETDLRKAIYSKSTLWPHGFRLEGKEMVYFQGDGEGEVERI